MRSRNITPPRFKPGADPGRFGLRRRWLVTVESVSLIGLPMPRIVAGKKVLRPIRTIRERRFRWAWVAWLYALSVNLPPSVALVITRATIDEVWE